MPLSKNDLRRMAQAQLHKEIGEAIERFEKTILALIEKTPAQRSVVKTVKNGAKTTIESVEEIAAILPHEPPARGRRRRRSSVLEHVMEHEARYPVPVERVDADDDEPAPIAKGPTKVLMAIADAGDAGAPRSILRIATDYTRQTIDKYLLELEREGLAIEVSGRWIITQVGKGELPAGVPPLPKGSALRAYYVATLPEGESVIAQIVFGAYPNEIERTAIDTATKYTRQTRDKYLGRLIKRLIVEETRRGFVRAAAHLFKA